MHPGCFIFPTFSASFLSSLFKVHIPHMPCYDPASAYYNSVYKTHKVTLFQDYFLLGRLSKKEPKWILSESKY